MKLRLRVLHVIPSVSDLRGGPTEALRVTTAALARHGMEVHVATTDDDGPGARLRVPAGGVTVRDSVTVHFFPRQTSFYSFSLPLTLWLWRHLPEFDVVHIHALFNYPALAAGWLARLRGVPYILRPLGTMAPWGFETRRPVLKRVSFWLLESGLLAHAAAVHCTSPLEREECLAHPECSASGTVVIPNPVEGHDGWPVGDPAASGATVLFLGRLDPKKGLEILLPAFAAVRQAMPEARLILAGSGEPDFVASLQASAARLLPEGSFAFTGFVKGEARREALEQATIFVLPSKTENFAISVVEAMERGVPVVISDQVGICRDVESRHAGFVVPLQPERVADAMLRLLRDPALRTEMGANGRVAARELYAPDSVAQALANLYTRVTRGADGTAERRPSHV